MKELEHFCHNMTFFAGARAGKQSIIDSNNHTIKILGSSITKKHLFELLQQRVLTRIDLTTAISKI